MKTKVRLYGSSPFFTAVIHGGPGAAGDMAPVARELSGKRGVLEPLQTENSLEGQVKELHDVLTEYGTVPLTLTGHSWGAMLSFIVAARYPALVRKLILVGSGPFEDKYARNITGERLLRLDEKNRVEALKLAESIYDSSTANRNSLMLKLAELYAKADAYDILPVDNEIIEFDEEINRLVWADANTMRKSGELLDLGNSIQCPVVAIHGDYDPHPAEGVKIPLSGILKDFRFTLLEKCGHTPWIEKSASKQFFDILNEELSD